MSNIAHVFGFVRSVRTPSKLIYSIWLPRLGGGWQSGGFGRDFFNDKLARKFLKNILKVELLQPEEARMCYTYGECWKITVTQYHAFMGIVGVVAVGLLIFLLIKSIIGNRKLTVRLEKMESKIELLVSHVNQTAPPPFQETGDIRKRSLGVAEVAYPQ